jgi:predicted RNA polymerase sigma factor
MQTEERRPGRYKVEAVIAALHHDAASAEEADWPQILAWYDDLVALTDDPVCQDPAAVLGRGRGRPPARAGRRPARRRGIRRARPPATDVAERDHLVRQASHARAAELYEQPSH